MHFKKLYLLISLSFLGSCVPKVINNPDNIPTVYGDDDPLAEYAWHLENTGQYVFAKYAGNSGEDFSIKEVHELGFKGEGVKIAISDSGVDLNHPDLKENQVVGGHRDYSKNSNWRNQNPYPIEEVGHGTSVAGLAAAVGWNGIGSRGVAPSAKYGAFLFVGDFQNSSTASSYEAKTLDQMTGIFDIFNYSYGYEGCSFVPTNSTIINAYKSGVTNLRSSLGAIYIQSAGNEYVSLNKYCDTNDDSYFLGNTNTSEDHNHPYIILVAALNAKGKRSSYSTPGSGIWVSSAGGEFGDDDPAMITTDLTSCSRGYSTSSSSESNFNSGNDSKNSNCDYTSIMNGTSSAAPVLSGIVALMLEANPNLSWRDVKHILAKTADKIDDVAPVALGHPAGSSGSLSGYTYDYKYVENAAGNSFSNLYGFGRANAYKAVTMARTYISELGIYEETEYYTSGSLNLPIPDKSSNGVTHALTVVENYSIESVQVKLTTNHNFIGDLGVELTSPSGKTSRLLLINSNIKDNGLDDFTLITNAFYEERSAGNWTLKIVDGAISDTGELLNWKIRINGHQ